MAKQISTNRFSFTIHAYGTYPVTSLRKIDKIKAMTCHKVLLQQTNSMRFQIFLNSELTFLCFSPGLLYLQELAPSSDLNWKKISSD
jgi:hypothetical protein